MPLDAEFACDLDQRREAALRELDAGHALDVEVVAAGPGQLRQHPELALALHQQPAAREHRRAASRAHVVAELAQLLRRQRIGVHAPLLQATVVAHQPPQRGQRRGGEQRLRLGADDHLRAGMLEQAPDRGERHGMQVRLRVLDHQQRSQAVRRAPQPAPDERPSDDQHAELLGSRAVDSHGATPGRPGARPEHVGDRRVRQAAGPLRLGLAQFQQFTRRGIARLELLQLVRRRAGQHRRVALLHLGHQLHQVR